VQPGRIFVFVRSTSNIQQQGVRHVVISTQSGINNVAVSVGDKRSQSSHCSTSMHVYYVFVWMRAIRFIYDGHIVCNTNISEYAENRFRVFTLYVIYYYCYCRVIDRV